MTNSAIRLLLILALLLVFPVAYTDNDHQGGDDKVKSLKDLENCVFEGAVAKFTDGKWTCSGDLTNLQAQIDALDARIAANASGIEKNASDLAYIHP